IVREVHPIPTAMVQPWMPLGIAYMLLMLSMGVPLVVFLFVKSLWIALAIPLLMLISYRVTAKDLYRF
ncbi:VirB3 family type IV secretion system protein, partial [Burkholderia cepacia]|uniref:VirB3 family type IV secretion system protein n=1 Tax=Burkholderia cepacia TaxID=292 RepID=UPI002ABE007D